MKHDSRVRNLTLLEISASTARVLNLNAVAKRMAHDPEYQLRPLFHNRALNRSIIIKHRLRRNEHEAFADYRLLATKVILPIEPNDLSAGAHYFFVGQKDYSQAIEELIGPEGQIDAHDRMVLKILDETPTLDPFVVREQLRRNGLEASRHYLDIGPADLSRMVAFVHRQIEPLAALSASGKAPFQDSTATLARKLLSSAVDQETEPLRQTLKLEIDDYREGVFCWKGFLYYKWCLEGLTPHVDQVVQEIGRVRLRGSTPANVRADVEKARAHLGLSMASTCASVRATIDIYDQAYRQLVEHGDPGSFREFLLNAPGLFFKLGAGLGAIQHIVSYWRYRFPPHALAMIDVAELTDILHDFLQGLEAFELDSAPETHSTASR